MDADLDEVKRGSPQWKRKLEEEVARRRSSKEWAAFGFAFERFFVRTFRIAAGIGFGLLALWLFNEAGDTLSKPFTELSPLGLLWGLVLGIAGIMCVIAALGTAFGEGESRDYYDARMEGSLRNQVEMQMEHEPWRFGLEAPYQVKERARWRFVRLWFWSIFGALAVISLAAILWAMRP